MTALGYIVAFLAGIIVGVFSGAVWLGDKTIVQVRRLVNKRIAGDNSVIIPVDAKKAEKDKKERKKLFKKKET